MSKNKPAQWKEVGGIVEDTPSIPELEGNQAGQMRTEI